MGRCIFCHAVCPVRQRQANPSLEGNRDVPRGGPADLRERICSRSFFRLRRLMAKRSFFFCFFFCSLDLSRTHSMCCFFFQFRPHVFPLQRKRQDFCFITILLDRKTEGTETWKGGIWGEGRRRRSPAWRIGVRPEGARGRAKSRSEEGRKEERNPVGR